MRCAKHLVSILLFLAAASARAQQTWTTGTFTYNGAGNVTAMGTDSYTYDSAGRLVRGTVLGAAQQYSYDAVGNRTDAATASTATNRITNHGASYDAAGNTTALDGMSFSYDGAGMVAHQTTSTTDWNFIYTADDERLATYTSR